MQECGAELLQLLFLGSRAVAVVLPVDGSSYHSKPTDTVI
jgi:hypothetical protein